MVSGVMGAFMRYHLLTKNNELKASTPLSLDQKGPCVSMNLQRTHQLSMILSMEQVLVIHVSSKLSEIQNDLLSVQCVGHSSCVTKS